MIYWAWINLKYFQTFRLILISTRVGSFLFDCFLYTLDYFFFIFDSFPWFFGYFLFSFLLQPFGFFLFIYNCFLILFDLFARGFQFSLFLILCYKKITFKFPSYSTCSSSYAFRLLQGQLFTLESYRISSFWI